MQPRPVQVPHLPARGLVLPRTAQARRRHLALQAAATAPQSLDLSQPDDVLQHCLTLFRKADAPALCPFLPPTAAVAAAAGDVAFHVRVGDTEVMESGSLSCLGEVLDVAARRVLPGHLLRRSKVLSTLRLGPAESLVRTAITACTGEEAVFSWRLRWRESLLAGFDDEEAARDDAEGSAGGGWVIEQVQRDATTDYPPPTTPHPKVSPEAVVKAQLHALAQGDVFEAASFNMWRSADPLAPRPGGRRAFSLGAHFEKLRALLEEPPYDVLLRPALVRLGPAALPTQRTMLQEVRVVADAMDTGAPETSRFLWRLGMQANGCWMVTAILPVLSDDDDNATAL